MPCVFPRAFAIGFPRFPRIVQTLAAVSALLLGIRPAHAQVTTQAFTLRVGWNSLWVEVDPTNHDIGQVFAGLPVESVWTYTAPSGIEFVQEQTEALFKQPGWQPYFPAGRPEAFLTRLFTVDAGQAYLVRVTNGPVSLTLTGRPVVRSQRWQPDSFNLRGVPADPDAPPTLEAFFRPSPAHTGQRAYSLAADGRWNLMTPQSLLRSGEAYWIYTRGPSGFMAPLSVTLPAGDRLDFGAVLSETAPLFENLDGTDKVVAIRDQTTPTPLAWATLVANRPTWTNVPALLQLPVAAGESSTLRLGIRRQAIAGTNYVSVLEVRDGAGTRHRVGVTAAVRTAARAGQEGGSVPADTTRIAGLWVGSASVTNVSEVNATTPRQPTPTHAPFDLRLLVHVDASGTPHLLKHVVQMWQDPSTAGGQGRYVLVTDESLLPSFKGATLRDGVLVGRRLSTIDFDFDGGTSNVVAMAGRFGDKASAVLALEPNAATNPFKHKYHPDHDNLDAAFKPLPAGAEEAYRVVRTIELQFTDTDPDAAAQGSASPDYGESIRGGVYRETVQGLHRTDIIASGTFRLNRVSNSPVLNR